MIDGLNIKSINSSKHGNIVRIINKDNKVIWNSHTKYTFTVQATNSNGTDTQTFNLLAME